MAKQQQASPTIHVGGSGTGSAINKGFAIYGSDGGHQSSGMGPGAAQNEPLATGPTTGDEWALNDEAIKNLGYMQMKKAHDAAVLIMKGCMVKGLS